MDFCTCLDASTHVSRVLSFHLHLHLGGAVIMRNWLLVSMRVVGNTVVGQTQAILIDQEFWMPRAKT